MSTLERDIRIRAVYTRSINLTRDADAADLIRSYVPTSRALEALERLADGLGDGSQQRAFAIIGPYGTGKSTFALFAAALLCAADDPRHQAALEVLKPSTPALAERFRQNVRSGRGVLRVALNGVPDSLVRQFMLALAIAVEQAELPAGLVDEILAAAQPGTPMDQVLCLVQRAQRAWKHAGGTGVLIEIDELGQFLEYESYHLQHRELHLLQLIAEHAQQAETERGLVPVHLLVLLHQAFEHYSQRLGKQLRDEWHKVQGRFESLAFLEPAEQSLRVVAAAFERDGPLPASLMTQLDQLTAALAAAGALPVGLEEAPARALFERCYPLHPITLLILPTLCQKVAQNERTLFSYLGSAEPFGLHERLARLRMGEWIGPWELYDYFILNQSGSVSDPLTYHRWFEVITALERFDSAPDDPAVDLLKTIGLLNLIGAQRGLKASEPLLSLLFGDQLDALRARLEAVSTIHFRSYSKELRVWQGSDFDLSAALREATAEQAQRALVEILETLAPLKPLVARRVTIESGTLRAFHPRFTAAVRWPPKAAGATLTSAGVALQEPQPLQLWIYLAEAEEQPTLEGAPPRSVIAVCHFTERLREAVAEWMALQELPHRHAALHHDPVAQREHRAWLTNAELETTALIRGLLEEPQALRWYWTSLERSPRERPVRDRRDLQEKLSAWVEHIGYPNAPHLRNELINRDQPSPSANLGRKRLLVAMLEAPTQPGLGINKTPAEKSLYLSLLQQSGLHRPREGTALYAIQPPPAADPCRLRPLWDAITESLGGAGDRQVTLPELYARLRRPPFGAKLGPLPVLIVAYLQAHRREVALYQEGAFCEALTVEQAELLCRRPELFALERFDLGGVRGALFERYITDIVGRIGAQATLLDVVRPLVRFISGLPEYAQQTKALSAPACAVRDAFHSARSPGTLLFDALPRACSTPIDDFTAADEAQVETFVQRLRTALQELKSAYPNLLIHWQGELARTLLGAPLADLAALRLAVRERYRGLDRLTPDRMGLGALIRRLCDTAHASDEAWLESVATLLGKMPPAKWREETRRLAELRLRDLAEQMRDLERLRLGAVEQGDGALPSRDGEPVLMKTVDGQRGEISRVIHLSTAQRAAANERAERIAATLTEVPEVDRLAVLALLWERFAQTDATGESNLD
ncbi:hypothetical protein CKO25_09120 [Thiocapsa imhoffii]|uniref:ATP-binding protein n=1 Tax=Thiocapsa imhoffii TaxID=382777 RepID=A0A9X0WHG8_9GAMM|nr:hypothetical protein [Thiocapsa imhoffii]MBK1644806.1 hypothetical protein [Thiocapsa imhoffii]